MNIMRSANGLKILSPAKINLFLEVLGKRKDGFHEIESVMQTVSLFDTLYLQSIKSRNQGNNRPSGITIRQG